VPFEPRIVRFDEEHAGRTAPLWAVATADARPTHVETPPQDPTHETLCGVEFDTIRDWDADDALLADPQLQCLARQLSDDAERLAKRFPADGWTPPSVEEPVIPAERESGARPAGGRTRSRAASWAHRSALLLASAVCLAVFLSPPQGGDTGPTFTTPGAQDGQILPPSSHPVAYENGESAAWGDDPIDDSQFGPGGVGLDSLPGGTPFGELLPPDSHEYCDVSM
jgi:hypothetical protein